MPLVNRFVPGYRVLESALLAARTMQIAEMEAQVMPATGPRLLVDIGIFPTDEAGLRLELEDGNCSLLFVVPALDDEPLCPRRGD